MTGKLQRRAGWEVPTCQDCQQAKKFWTPTGYIPVKALGHPSRAGFAENGVWVCERCDRVQRRSVG